VRESNAMDLSQSERELLTHIRKAREKRETTPARADELGVGVEEAYRVQAAMGEGRLVLGYKLGLLAPAKQAQMGVNAPIYGRVYEGMVLVQLGRSIPSVGSLADVPYTPV
jgi:2-keto-4-pentenoate hydratase